MPKNVDKKNQIFPEHFQLYVGTGMRAVCIFCTSCKNQKNSWGYPSNPNLISFEKMVSENHRKTSKRILKLNVIFAGTLMIN